VIRMDVAGLTQWGSNWWREWVCGRGGIRRNCGNQWKTETPRAKGFKCKACDALFCVLYQHAVLTDYFSISARSFRPRSVARKQ
jgi:hypothetical protein